MCRSPSMTSSMRINFKYDNSKSPITVSPSFPTTLVQSALQLSEEGREYYVGYNLPPPSV